MRWVVVMALVSCGPPAPPAEPPKPVEDLGTDCTQLRTVARNHRATGELARAIATYRSGLPACDFHLELGLVLVDQGDVDAAAAEYLIVLRTARPAGSLFESLSSIYDRLSPDRRTEVLRLGRTKDTAIHVPAADLAYAWLDRFACTNGRATRRGQTVVEHRGRRLDTLLVSCADGVEQMI